MKKPKLTKATTRDEMERLAQEGYTVRAHYENDRRHSPPEYWWMAPPEEAAPEPLEEPAPESKDPEPEPPLVASEEAPRDHDASRKKGRNKKKTRGSGESGLTATDEILQESEGGE